MAHVDPSKPLGDGGKKTTKQLEDEEIEKQGKGGPTSVSTPREANFPEHTRKK